MENLKVSTTYQFYLFTIFKEVFIFFRNKVRFSYKCAYKLSYILRAGRFYHDLEKLLGNSKNKLFKRLV